MDKRNSTTTLLDDGYESAAHDTGQSILILLIFFIVILSLFGTGMGLSYLCYKRALKKRKERERREQRLRAERLLHPYRAIAAARRVRGIPNMYAPNPKDENSHLLDLPVTSIPIQMQSNNHY